MNTQITAPFAINGAWLLGVAFIVIIFLIVFLIMFITKAPWSKTLAILPQKSKININAIKARYLQQLIEIDSQYQQSIIDERVAHNRLSIVIRLFANEVTGYNFLSLTLMELEKTTYRQLTEVIKLCYPKEFALGQEDSTFPKASEKAKEVVNQWS